MPSWQRSSGIEWWPWPFLVEFACSLPTCLKFPSTVPKHALCAHWRLSIVHNNCLYVLSDWRVTFHVPCFSAKVTDGRHELGLDPELYLPVLIIIILWLQNFLNSSSTFTVVFLHLSTHISLPANGFSINSTWWQLIYSQPVVTMRSKCVWPSRKRLEWEACFLLSQMKQKHILHAVLCLMETVARGLKCNILQSFVSVCPAC